MSYPLHIPLPSSLKMRPIVGALRRAGLDLKAPPPAVAFDFSSIGFAEPTGVVFLHNLTRYLCGRGVEVTYVDCDRAGAALRFMDDIGFFEDQLGFRLSSSSRCRPTTLRLREVHQEDAPTWINTTFVPWLADCSNRPEATLGSLGTCISEIFNNIRDHSGAKVGSIFGQWFPNVDRLRIAISDMGAGIPATVARMRPDMTPEQTILAAFEDGFSTKSNPRNRGSGLDFLLNKVSKDLKGSLTVYSGRRVAHVQDGGRLAVLSAMLDDVGYTGTLFDIVMPTGQIAALSDDTEVDVW